MTSSYPFAAKSIRSLRAGHFWAIPLVDGRFASGIVVELHSEHSRQFMAALLDWVDDDPPTGDSINDAGILQVGKAGIRMIKRAGGPILGRRDLASFPLEVPETLSHAFGDVWIERGYIVGIRKATAEEKATLKVNGTFGYGYLNSLANYRFCGVTPTD